MRIALDAMGGDLAPAAAVAGAVRYLRRGGAASVALVGDAKRIKDELARHKAPGSFSVHDAPHAIGPGERPSRAARPKRRSSIHACFDLVRSGQADAVVSAGGSGALMAAALHSLGRIDGVERPAIVTPLPTLRGGCAVLLDSGANVACRPLHLVQFAHLGEVWARRVVGVARPKVALLANGEEPTKGTDLTRAASELLRASSLDFVGYVEGKDLFDGGVDVIVTDGFTGNVVLKATEGAAAALGAMLKREIEARSTARLGKLLMAPALAGFKKIVDWAEYGGAPLVGVDGVCIVAHGRSTPRAFKNALATASQVCSTSLRDDFARAALAARELIGSTAARHAAER
ncbi:MAG: phosphate acyltransferase PlsX [Myxococcales bacterium]|jgi:glycerol-3-phosphate acyltransferase PlsX